MGNGDCKHEQMLVIVKWIVKEWADNGVSVHYV